MCKPVSSASILRMILLSVVKIMQSHAAKGLIISFFDMLLLCSWCMAYRNGPLEMTCERFHVSHGSNARNINENVTILLHKVDGTQIVCIQPSQEYTGAHIICMLGIGLVTTLVATLLCNCNEILEAKKAWDKAKSNLQLYFVQSWEMM